MAKKTSFTFPLTPEQQTALIELLQTGNYRPQHVPHTIIAATTPGYNVSLYKSGKCLVQGKEAEDFVTFVLEPQVLQSVSLGYEDIVNPEESSPHMGVDESGKGDFFGPMVIAAVYVDKGLVATMREMKVRDSKTITSNKVALGIARDLRELLGGNRYSVVTIGPAAYNRMYQKMRNVNTMLAWGHARAIEDLLATTPSCPKAISDQFGNESLIRKALMTRGAKIELVQRHKAEADMAVAAASIIARAGFLLGLEKIGRDLGVEPPRGASEAVQLAGVELVNKHGPEALLRTAKCHFQTADRVLQRANRSRADLGPEGQAKSRPYTGRGAKAKG